MKKFLSILLTMVMLLSLMTIGVGAAADTPAISGPLGDVWVVSKADRGTANLTADVANFQLSTVNKASGTYSLRMNKPVTTMSNSNLAVKFPVTLENGESYTIKFKTTIDSIGVANSAVRQYVYIGPVNNNNNTSNASCRYFGNTSGVFTTEELGYIGDRKWRYVTCSYTAPAENGENLFLVLNVANNRTIDEYFDDFEIIKKADETSDETQVKILNADFDYIPESVISGTIGDVWVVSKANRGTGNLTADVANFQHSLLSYTGDYSLRMVKPVSSMVNANLAVKFPVTLENGESYTIKFKTTMDSIGSGGGARPYIYIGPVGNNSNTSNADCHYFSSSTAGYTIVTTTSVKGKNWRDMTLNYTAPAENGTELYLALNVANSRSDIDVYFDDFEIIKNSNGSKVALLNGGFDTPFEPIPVVEGTIGSSWVVSQSKTINPDLANFQLSVEAYSSPYALKMVKTADTVGGKLSIKFPVTLTSGEEYTISFKMNHSEAQYVGGNGVIRNSVFLSPEKRVVSGVSKLFSSSAFTHTTAGTANGIEWDTVTVNYTAPAEDGTKLYLVMDTDTAGERAINFLFDNFEITKVSDGTAVILPNSDFDSGETEAAEVENLSEENGVLSWDSGSYHYVNIYEKKTNGALVQINEENVTATSFLLKDKFYETKTYVVRAVSTIDGKVVESSGSEIEVAGKYAVDEDEKFETVTFEDGFSVVGENAVVQGQITSIQNGNIMSSMTIRNTYSEAIPVFYVMSLYNGDLLERVAVISKDIEQDATETLKTVINVEDINDGNYTIRTLLWDNSTLEPLKKKVTLYETD